MITASAPGKVILFGEHAVVYDKLGITCSFDKRCQVSTSIFNQDFISIKSENFNLNKSMEKEDLFFFLNKINNLVEKKQFKEINLIFQEDRLSPSFFVVANILDKYGFKGMEIKVNSGIPKNLGSSSAVFSALTLSILYSLGMNPSKEEISNFAYLGDIIAHGGTPSGIDNSIVTYGSYLQYQKSKGIEILNIDFKIPLLIVNSGEDVRTGEMVSYIRNQKEQSPKVVDAVLDSLDNLSKKALIGLRDQSLHIIGELMNNYYQELRKLNISTKKLDQIVEIALNNNALGAKPTGGWGGGCCLVLMEKEEDLEKMATIFNKKGFYSFIGKTGVEGVKIIQNKQ